MDDRGNENARPGDETGRARVLPEMKSTKAFNSNDAVSADLRKPSFESETRALIAAGLTLVPLHVWNAVETDNDGKSIQKGKAPLHGKWQEKAYDAATIVATAEKAALNVGVRVSGSDLLVIDVDPRNFDGVDSFENLKRDFGFDPSDYPCVQTGGGGLHVYMRRAAGIDYAQSLDEYPGIDFKTSGQVVAPGSLHPVTGLPYVGENLDLLALELPAPAALLDRLDKSKGRSKPSDGVSRVGEIGPAQLAANLTQIDVESFADYGAWLEVMMACHAATAGEGLDEFVQWSTAFSGDAASPDAIREKWEGFSLDGHGITSRTLYGLVEKAGGKPIDRMEASEDFEVYDAPDEEDAEWTLITLDDLARMKPPKWIVHEAIQEESIAVVYGPPGAGKSFLAIDFGLCMASGIPWHGREVAKGNVLYVAAEGARGLAKRTQAWLQEHNMTLSPTAFQLIRQELNLSNPAQAKRFLKFVERESKKTRFGLIVIDTLSQTSTGADENSNTEMAAYFKRVQAIVNVSGATTLVVHHSGKDTTKGERGAFAIRGNVDTSIEVKRTGEGMTILVEAKKQKDGEEGRIAELDMVRVDLIACDGTPTSSLVLRSSMRSIEGVAEDFLDRHEYDWIAEWVRANGTDGRAPYKDLVSAYAERGNVKQSASRSRLDRIFGPVVGSGHSKLCSDGARIWLELENDKNSRSPKEVVLAAV